MTLTGLLILASGFVLVTLATVPAVSRQIRGLFFSAGSSGKLHYAWLIVFMLVMVQLVGQSITMAAGIMVAPLNDPEGGFGWGMGAIGAGLATYYLAQIHRRDDYAAAERVIGAREGDGPGTIWGRGARCLSSVAAGRLCDSLRMLVRAR